MSNVSLEKTDWLWTRTVPLGRLSVWYGDGENGKSLTTIEFAARGSRGQPMPGDAERRAPFSTIIVQTEDDVASTIRPRLEAAGGDISKVTVLNTVDHSDGGETSFHAVNHVEQLSHAIDELGDCKLLIIDPLSEFMSGVNFWKDDSLRPALVPLKRLAEQKHIAVVLIAHLNKGEGNAKQRLNGAQTLINICRAGWLFCPHPDDAETYLMLRAKGNGTKRNQNGYSFTLADEKLFGPEADGVPKLCWIDEPVTLTADEALARQRAKSKSGEPAKANKFDETVRWLQMMLAGGPKSPREIWLMAKEHLDISRATLDRAKTSLGITKNTLHLWELPKQPSAP